MVRSNDIPEKVCEHFPINNDPKELADDPSGQVKTEDFHLDKSV